MSATEQAVRQAVQSGANPDDLQKVQDQLNSVDIDLNMTQMAGADVMSVSKVTMNMPRIERNLGNIVNHQTATMVLLSNLELSIGQASERAPEQLRYYVQYCQGTAQKYQQLADLAAGGGA